MVFPIRNLQSLPVLAFAVMVSACGQDDAGAMTAANGTPTAPASAAAEPVPSESPEPAADGRTEKLSNDLVEFSYAYPDAAARYPGLRAMLDAKLDEARKGLESEARKDRADAQAEGFPYRPHSSDTTWKVVTQTPRFLSLSAETYYYMGGAHGNTGFETVLWDRKDNVARQPLDLFASKDALRSALREPFCAALDRARAVKRGGPISRNPDDSFDACIDPLESVVILGSTDGKAFDRIGVLVPPYAAGAYAEGSYDITVPLSRGLADAVRPQFRDAFAVR